MVGILVHGWYPLSRVYEDGLGQQQNAASIVLNSHKPLCGLVADSFPLCSNMQAHYSVAPPYITAWCRSTIT